MQGFVIPIRFRMFQSETYVRENEILEKKKKYSNVCFQNQKLKNFKNWLTNMQLQWTCSEDSCEKSFAGADHLRRLIKTIHEVQRYQM